MKSMIRSFEVVVDNEGNIYNTSDREAVRRKLGIPLSQLRIENACDPYIEFKILVYGYRKLR